MGGLPQAIAPRDSGIVRPRPRARLPYGRRPRRVPEHWQHHQQPEEERHHCHGERGGDRRCPDQQGRSAGRRRPAQASASRPKRLPHHARERILQLPRPGPEVPRRSGRHLRRLHPQPQVKVREGMPHLHSDVAPIGRERRPRLRRLLRPVRSRKAEHPAEQPRRGPLLHQHRPVGPHGQIDGAETHRLHSLRRTARQLARQCRAAGPRIPSSRRRSRTPAHAACRSWRRDPSPPARSRPAASQGSAAPPARRARPSPPAVAPPPRKGGPSPARHCRRPPPPAGRRRSRRSPQRYRGRCRAAPAARPRCRETARRPPRPVARRRAGCVPARNSQAPPRRPSPRHPRPPPATPRPASARRRPRNSPEPPPRWSAGALPPTATPGRDPPACPTPGAPARAGRAPNGRTRQAAPSPVSPGPPLSPVADASSCPVHVAQSQIAHLGGLTRARRRASLWP